MYILGIGQIGGQDSSAVLIKNGKIILAIEEERLTRIKHKGGFPKEAISKILEIEGITFSEINHIAIVDRPVFRFIRRITDWYLPKMIKHPMNSIYHIFHDEVPTILKFFKIKKKLLIDSNYRAKIHFVEHHLTHMASAFLLSEFEEAAILTLDARGEIATTAIGIGRGNQIQKLKEAQMPHSLGVFYAAITNYLGFMHGSDEYKVMGLASYGKPSYLKKFRDLIKFNKKKLLITNLKYFSYQNGRGFFSKHFFNKFGPPRKSNEPITDHHKDLASSAQHLLEELLVQLATHVKEITNMKNLCMAGGVALNCVANGKLYEKKIFDNIFVQPASGDNGGALGAAYYVHNSILKNKKNFIMNSALLGPEISDIEIEDALKISKLKYVKSKNICEETAHELAGGKIVGWYQSKMEFGPRALGSRSILADPTDPKMKDRINSYVKFREEFRPFTPSVKSEKANEYFNIDFISRFMLFVAPVREIYKNILPSITHVDGTARIQCVEKSVQPLYWNLLNEFEKIKKVPIVLNTSFNIMGEPIVYSPSQALRCFYGSGIDTLVLGNYIIRK